MNIGLAAPEFALIGTAIAVIVLDLFITRKRWLVYVCLAGLAIAAALTLAMWGDHPQLVFNNMLAVDNFAFFFKFVFLGVSFLIILASYESLISNIFKYQS